MIKATGKSRWDHYRAELRSFCSIKADNERSNISLSDTEKWDLKRKEEEHCPIRILKDNRSETSSSAKQKTLFWKKFSPIFRRENLWARHEVVADAYHVRHVIPCWWDWWPFGCPSDPGRWSRPWWRWSTSSARCSATLWGDGMPFWLGKCFKINTRSLPGRNTEFQDCSPINTLPKTERNVNENLMSGEE